MWPSSLSFDKVRIPLLRMLFMRKPTYCGMPAPAGSLIGGFCKNRVRRDGDRCYRHGGHPSLGAIIERLEFADLRCGNDQHETKEILQAVIAELKDRKTTWVNR